MDGSGAALAHVHLRDSSPADGARLAAAPTALTLSFSEPAQLTALSLQQDQGSSWKLSAPAEPQLRVVQRLVDSACHITGIEQRDPQPGILGGRDQRLPHRVRIVVPLPAGRSKSYRWM